MTYMAYDDSIGSLWVDWFLNASQLLLLLFAQQCCVVLSAVEMFSWGLQRNSHHRSLF